MTTLEGHMRQVIEQARYDFGNAVGGNEDCFIARAAAKVALELALEAYNQGCSDATTYEWGGPNKTFQQFIKDYQP